MNFLDKAGLRTLLNQLKIIFGCKSALDAVAEARRANLVEIDYDAVLKFDTSFLVGDNSPYIGLATVGNTYVA